MEILHVFLPYFVDLRTFIVLLLKIFIYLGFYVAFNTVQVISRRVVGRAEETSTYSSLGFCTVNCQPTASNYQLSHLRLCREPNPDLRGGRLSKISYCMRLHNLHLACQHLYPKKKLKILETDQKSERLHLGFLTAILLRSNITYFGFGSSSSWPV